MTHQKPLTCTILAALAATAVAQTLLELAKYIIDRIRTILGLDPPTRMRYPGIIFDCATSFIIGFIITRLRQTAHSDAKTPPKPSIRCSNRSLSRSRTSRQPLSTTNPPPHPQKRCDLRKRAARSGRGPENHCQ